MIKAAVSRERRVHCMDTRGGLVPDSRFVSKEVVLDIYLLFKEGNGVGHPSSILSWQIFYQRSHYSTCLKNILKIFFRF